MTLTIGQLRTHQQQFTIHLSTSMPKPTSPLLDTSDMNTSSRAFESRYDLAAAQPAWAFQFCVVDCAIRCQFATSYRLSLLSLRASGLDRPATCMTPSRSSFEVPPHTYIRTIIAWMHKSRSQNLFYVLWPCVNSSSLRSYRFTLEGDQSGTLHWQTLLLHRQRVKLFEWPSCCSKNGKG